MPARLINAAEVLHQIKRDGHSNTEKPCSTCKQASDVLNSRKLNESEVDSTQYDRRRA